MFSMSLTSKSVTGSRAVNAELMWEGKIIQRIGLLFPSSGDFTDLTLAERLSGHCTASYEPIRNSYTFSINLAEQDLGLDVDSQVAMLFCYVRELMNDRTPHRTDLSISWDIEKGLPIPDSLLEIVARTESAIPDDFCSNLCRSLMSYIPEDWNLETLRGHKNKPGGLASYLLAYPSREIIPPKRLEPPKPTPCIKLDILSKPSVAVVTLALESREEVAQGCVKLPEEATYEVSETSKYVPPEVVFQKKFNLECEEPEVQMSGVIIDALHEINALISHFPWSDLMIDLEKQHSKADTRVQDHWGGLLAAVKSFTSLSTHETDKKSEDPSAKSQTEIEVPKTLCLALLKRAGYRIPKMDHWETPVALGFIGADGAFQPLVMMTSRIDHAVNPREVRNRLQVHESSGAVFFVAPEQLSKAPYKTQMYFMRRQLRAFITRAMWEGHFSNHDQATTESLTPLKSQLAEAFGIKKACRVSEHWCMELSVWFKMAFPESPELPFLAELGASELSNSSVLGVLTKIWGNSNGVWSAHMQGSRARAAHGSSVVAGAGAAAEPPPAPSAPPALASILSRPPEAAKASEPKAPVGGACSGSSDAGAVTDSPSAGAGDVSAPAPFTPDGFYSLVLFTKWTERACSSGAFYILPAALCRNEEVVFTFHVFAAQEPQDAHFKACQIEADEDRVDVISRVSSPFGGFITRINQPSASVNAPLHERLFGIFDKLSRPGVFRLTSNSYAMSVPYKYGDDSIYVIKCHFEIACESARVSDFRSLMRVAGADWLSHMGPITSEEDIRKAYKAAVRAPAREAVVFRGAAKVVPPGAGIELTGLKKDPGE